MAEPAAPPDTSALPAGTVTFLFTDLEGSTRLLEAHPPASREAVRRHHAKKPSFIGRIEHVTSTPGS